MRSGYPVDRPFHDHRIFATHLLQRPDPEYTAHSSPQRSSVIVIIAVAGADQVYKGNQRCFLSLSKITRTINPPAIIDSSSPAFVGDG